MASDPNTNAVDYEIWCEQLRAKNEQLEQQLAQARAELETTLDYAQGLEVWQVTATALLEDASTCGDAALESRIRAFLAQPA